MTYPAYFKVFFNNSIFISMRGDFERLKLFEILKDFVEHIHLEIFQKASHMFFSPSNSLAVMLIIKCIKEMKYNVHILNQRLNRSSEEG